MSATDPFDVDLQRAAISAELNSNLIQLYLMVQKQNRTPSRDRVIIGSMSLFYCGATLSLAATWFTNSVFYTGGGTRVEIIFENLGTSNLPVAITILNICVEMFSRMRSVLSQKLTTVCTVNGGNR
ncbi:hypothetical protein D9613_012225 [Agrocybe pediades]|uniref:Uncharacterized protein n=1 Tax=Agrocybe pediades TaxID=84607 RepID=A0A8H4QEK5_9AGAR|nr:hypothetical protein D9613_012225 [Agrocybe pediades]